MDARQGIIRLPLASAGNGSVRRGGATLDEVELIHRVAARDGAAFEALYRGYCPRLRRFVARITRCPQIVDEIVNDTMLVVWRKASSFNLASKVSTWIFGIAFRRALKASKRLDNPMEFDPDDCQAASTSEPERLLLEEERRATIARALRALSHEHRAVLELCYFDGRSFAEIAGIMGCPVNTVKTRMFHARRRLRTLMADKSSVEIAGSDSCPARREARE